MFVNIFISISEDLPIFVMSRTHFLMHERKGHEKIDHKYEQLHSFDHAMESVEKTFIYQNDDEINTLTC